MKTIEMINHIVADDTKNIDRFKNIEIWWTF